MGRGRKKQQKPVEQVAEPVVEQPVEEKPVVEEQKQVEEAPKVEESVQEKVEKVEDVQLKITQDDVQRAIAEQKKMEEQRRIQAKTNVALGIFNSFIMSGKPMSDVNSQKYIELSFECAEKFLKHSESLSK